MFDSFDVLVVPSIWLENSPLVVHEAFMFGVPVIGSRIGGTADLIQDGINGFLYEPEWPGNLLVSFSNSSKHPSGSPLS